MPDRRRDPVQDDLNAKRRAQVAALYLQRLTMGEIATAVGVSKATVSKDIKKTRIQWRAEAPATFEEAVLHELARMDADEARLRGRWALQTDEKLKLEIYDRILEICRDRRRVLGMERARFDVSMPGGHTLAGLLGLDKKKEADGNGGDTNGLDAETIERERALRALPPAQRRIAWQKAIEFAKAMNPVPAHVRLIDDEDDDDVIDGEVVQSTDNGGPQP